ncbi:MAG: nuclear transport factor 2 family protein [Melioribacteraceae bacterium]
MLKLIERDADIFDKYREVSVRDSLRKEIISPGYFYHGIDGKPIVIDGLTKRQTINQFQLLAEEVLSETLYQYENSAILVYIVKLRVKDKGEVHDRLRSSLIVFSKENGEWKIMADIVGQDPSN